MLQNELFDIQPPKATEIRTGQLLKWIGNKQRFAKSIISYFPSEYNTYYEPFLGSGAILGALCPKIGFGSDIYSPLMDIWKTLKVEPETLVKWYSERWSRIQNENKIDVYEDVKKSFNKKPNGADFVFLSRACYGGVIRFRKIDGYMSTPCGAHSPIHPESFKKRVYDWRERVKGTEFYCSDYKEIIKSAKKGDLIYCDPPYAYSQAIVYGAQGFSIEELFEEIFKCKQKGVYVALSIDGTKKSGKMQCDLNIPSGLFEKEIYVNTGRSMLRRFQMIGETLENEHVTDKLLLTY